MNTILWVLQSLMAIVFLIPGVLKLIFSKDELVEKGLTALEDFSVPTILLIGVFEVSGAIGIIAPPLLNILPMLPTYSAIGFALIMVSAAFISLKRGEYKKIGYLAVIFMICVFIAYDRIVYAA